MKKFSFTLCLCALVALLILPPVLARRPTRARKPARPTPVLNAPTRNTASATVAAAQPPASIAAEAMTTAPGTVIDPALLPALPVPLTLRPEEDEEENEETIESDLDPATLMRLKRQPYVAPEQMPASYTAQADGTSKSTTKAVAARPGTPLAPSLLRNFTGPNSDQQGDGFVRLPPDPDITTGPNHIVTVVNTIIAVYDKNGTQLQIGNLGTRFSNVCSGCRVFDPRVIYDPNANRFVVMMVTRDDATHVSKALVAVSQTDDPTGAWWNYALDTKLVYNNEDTWADYPDIGFDGIAADAGGAIYLTFNQFTFDSRQFRTSMLLILPKASLYTGASLSYWRAWDRLNAEGSQVFTLRPAKTYGNPGVEFMVNSRNNGSFATLWRVAPTYPPTAVNWTLQTTYNIGTYALPPQAQQPGCSDTHDTGDNRMYNAVWRNDRIYAAFTEAHDWGSGGGTVAAVRYLKLNTSSNTAEINQTFGADGLNYSYPAIATDSAENIVLTFARTNSQEFGSIRFTGRLTTDTTMQSSALLKSGAQCLTGSRYGDYQGAAIDPADGTKVWVFGEYAANTASVDSFYDWGTWVGQVQFGAGTNCSYTLSPTSNSVGSSGASGSFNVTTQTGCAWTATSNASWISVSGSSSGSGTASYSVGANTGSAARTGTISVADQFFTITQAGNTCTSGTALSFGQSVTGALSTTDCGATFRSGSFADRYTFTGTAGQQVALSLSSTAFDTYLYLIAPSGTLATSDDDGGGGTNSRIPPGAGFYTLPSTGTYNIEATSFSAGFTGSYTLTLSTTGGSNGIETAGLYNPAGGSFFLRNSNTQGVADVAFAYGPAGAGWLPIVGDWNGDGIDTTGLYNPAGGSFFLRNSNSQGVADIAFTYGPAGAGWLPIAGDWNGDGIDTIGLYSPSNSAFFLRNSNSSGTADIVFFYGPAGAGWTPLAGDWDGNNVDTIGLYNPGGGSFFLRNSNTQGVADVAFTYGPAGAGWRPLAGDWDNNGVDTAGLYSPSNSAFFLRNTNASGTADIVFFYGPAGAGWTPLGGDWNGL